MYGRHNPNVKTTRQRITDLVLAGEVVTAVGLKARLKISHTTARNRLCDMFATGELVRVGYGKYASGPMAGKWKPRQRSDHGRALQKAWLNALSFTTGKAVGPG